MFAKLAFDALKAMRYDALAVDLDGALDGELVSRVLFNGTNQTPSEARGGLLAQLTGLPFRFNITIRAPFRGLLNSVQAFSDPRLGDSLRDSVGGYLADQDPRRLAEVLMAGLAHEELGTHGAGRREVDVREAAQAGEGRVEGDQRGLAAERQG